MVKYKHAIINKKEELKKCKNNTTIKNFSLLKGATYVGEAKTLQPYAMFVETHGQYPYLIDKPFYQIEGEIYEIESKELSLVTTVSVVMHT